MIAPLIVALLSLIGAFVLIAHVFSQMEGERRSWATERAALLDRIQHPHIPQTPTIVMPPMEMPEADEFDRVGTIHYGDSDMNGHGE